MKFTERVNSSWWYWRTDSSVGWLFNKRLIPSVLLVTVLTRSSTEATLFLPWFEKCIMKTLNIIHIAIMHVAICLENLSMFSFAYVIDFLILKLLRVDCRGHKWSKEYSWFLSFCSYNYSACAKVKILLRDRVLEPIIWNRNIFEKVFRWNLEFRSKN